MACGCRSSGECWHFTKLQWAEMTAYSRRLVRARLRALEELYYRVEESVKTGALLPDGWAEAVHKVQAAERGQLE